MKPVFLLLILCFYTTISLGQNNYSFLFYNVENLMDTEDNPSTSDDEFTPQGNRFWSEYKLQQKIDHLAKVIIASNGFTPPDVVGLCEVENYKVVERLINSTPLHKLGYKYIHKESPDNRGIDVALLYRSDRIFPLKYKYHPLIENSGDTLNTREILACQFVAKSDSFTIFINHWPSRYGGELNTAPMRQLAAHTLWDAVTASRDSSINQIIILGDFNDEPENKSMQWLCRKEHNLYNLSADWKKNEGTLKFQGVWSIFDQIIISTNLQEKQAKGEIVSLPFLFKDDEKWGGKKLFRTFYGFKYEGGFSDHLPILLHLKL